LSDESTEKFDGGLRVGRVVVSALAAGFFVAATATGFTFWGHCCVVVVVVVVVIGSGNVLGVVVRVVVLFTF
jgi:hypothetical protein